MRTAAAALAVVLSVGPAAAEPAVDFTLPDIKSILHQVAGATIKTPPATASGCHAEGGLLAQIVAAQACVADQPAGFLTRNGALRRVSLAILDSAGAIRLVQIQQGGPDEVKVLKGDARLVLRRNNWINSDFQVVDPPGGKVLAVRYPLGERDARVYTPYSPELAVPDVLAAGLLVKDDLIDRAVAKLRDAGVRSRAFPDKLVVDVVPREVLTVLLMIEHINPDDFQSSDVTADQVGKVLVILAANKERAYAHNVSPAGASGLVQMMPYTYQMLLGAYPSARLDKKFERGAADAVNAIMAQMLLCDHDWALLRAAPNQTNIAPERIGPYLAACYNGGCSPVLRAFADGSYAWLEAPDLSKPPAAKKKTMIAVGRGKNRRWVPRTTLFLPETMHYVLFYTWVQAHFEKIKAQGFTSSSAQPVSAQAPPAAPTSSETDPSASFGP